MPERTEIEKYVRGLVSADITYRPLKSLGEKGVRRIDKKAEDLAGLLRKGEEKGNRIEARIEERPEEEKARTLNEGIDEFCKKYPPYGKILKGLIEEKRIERRNYLIYNIKEGYKLSEEDYIKILEEIGFNKREAASIYPHILAISERLGKAGENLERNILLKEQVKKSKARRKEK